MEAMVAIEASGLVWVEGGQTRRRKSSVLIGMPRREKTLVREWLFIAIDVRKEHSFKPYHSRLLIDLLTSMYSHAKVRNLTHLR